MSKLCTIKLDTPSWLRRAVVYIAVPAAAILGVSAAVNANVVVPNTFQDGEILDATKMNANFKALQDAANASVVYTNRETNETTAIVGRPCGVSGKTSGKIVNGPATGYAAARQYCKAAAGCSASARMCTVHEVVLYATTGGSTATFTTDSAVWVASGTLSGDLSGYTYDCGGYTDDPASNLGSAWSPTNVPGREPCSNAVRILCCD